MGTTFRIVLYAADKATAKKAAEAAFARVAELDDCMSDYKQTSELMRLCKKFATEVGEPVKVSDDLFVVLHEGRGAVEEVGRRVRRDRRAGGATLAARPADAGTPRPEGVRRGPREGRLREGEARRREEDRAAARRRECNSTSAASPRATPPTRR